MNLGRCPVCHSRISLEAIVQDEAGRELLALLAKLDAVVAVPLVTYLGLFRPEQRDLANDRALRLAREVLDLGTGPALAQAMANTVESIRGKGGTPLKNHNYLKQVLTSVSASTDVAVSNIGLLEQGTKHVPSRSMQALKNLSEVSGRYED